MIARITIIAQRYLWRYPLLRANLVRLLGIGAVLMAEILVGLLIARGTTMFALVLVALPGLYFLIHFHRFGVLLILVSALFVRFKIPTGTASNIVASMAVTGTVAGVWILGMVLKKENASLKPAPVNRPFILFSIVATLSFFWSNVYRDPLVNVWGSWFFVQLASLLVIILLPSVFVITSNLVHKEQTLKWMVAIIMSMGMVGVIADVMGISALRFINVHGLFAMVAISLGYSLALFDKSLPWWIRIILLVIAGLWVYRAFVLAITWLSGWVPSLSSLGTITLIRSRKLFALILVLCLLFLVIQYDYFYEMIFLHSEEEGDFLRWDAWMVNWRVTSRHILLGTGPAGYAAYYMTYYPNEGMATHSNYVDIVSQLGILGLGTYLWMMGAMGKMGRDLYRRCRDHDNFMTGLAVAGLGGWVGALVAMALGDWMIPFAYTQGIEGYDYALYAWLILGMMGAGWHITRQNNA